MQQSHQWNMEVKFTFCLASAAYNIQFRLQSKYYTTLLPTHPVQKYVYMAETTLQYAVDDRKVLTIPISPWTFCSEMESS